MTRARRFIPICLKFLISLILCLVVGVVWHEVVGHGLVGVLLGARIENVIVLGVRIWPGLGWDGWPDIYGSCQLAGELSPTADAIMRLAGSMSTWLVSAVAIGLLWARRWPTAMHRVLAWLGIWWIDLLTYTLPSWGFRRSILWGAVYGEPYEAAIELGIPGLLFQVFAVGSGLLLGAALVIRLVRDRRLAVGEGDRSAA